MNTTYDIAVWLMLSLLTLCLFIGMVYLWLSIRLFNWLRKQRDMHVRARTIQVKTVGSEEEAQSVPVRVIKNDSEAKPAALNPHAEAENEVHELDRKTHSLSVEGDMDAAKAAAIDALSKGIRKLGGDHWLIARLLNRLACIELCTSDNFPALTHLEAATAILSEWPGTADEDAESVKQNLDYCHSRLGL